MFAISLWQPYASLIAIGKKQIETRSWPAPPHIIGQRIAIHAAKKWDSDLDDLCHQEPFHTDLEAAGFASGRGDIEYLPLGMVVATATLSACHSANDDDFFASLTEREMAYGDYAPDRFGWVLSDIQRIEPPIPAKGAQGIWT